MAVMLTFKSKADCVNVLTGLAKSDVLLTFPSPTIVDVIPLTVPLNEGDAIGAFNAKAVFKADVNTYELNEDDK